MDNECTSGNEWGFLVLDEMRPRLKEASNRPLLELQNGALSTAAIAATSASTTSTTSTCASTSAQRGRPPV